MKKFLLDIYEVYKPLRLAVAGVFGFIAANQILNLGGPYFMSKLIDQLAKSQMGVTYHVMLACLAALWIFRVTAFRLWRERYELQNLDGAIPERMQQYTMQKLFGFSIGQHTSENSGIKQSVVNRGENALENMMQLLVYQALPLAVESVILTAVLLYMAPPIGFIVLASLVTCIIFIWKLNGAFRKEFRKIEHLNIQDSKLKGEIIRNIGMIMVQAQEERAEKECHDSQESVYAYTKNVWLRFLKWAALRDSIPQLARVIVIYFASRKVIHHDYTLGQWLMFSTWTASSLGNLGEMSGLHRQIIRAYTSIRRYFDMLSIEPDVKVIENPVRPKKFFGEIRFEDVTFEYQKRESAPKAPEDEEDEDDEEETPAEEAPKLIGPALDGVTFTIRPGQTVAFVGSSGAGKSTLIKALVRGQDPVKGRILVDGYDLRTLDLKHFRSSIGLVDQDVSLFDQSLRYNITYGINANGRIIGDHELHGVAKLSRVDRFWDRLENGFDTIIGERGVKLSGGERQRVGIARALVKEPDILIFDEATSNLDSENEAMIRESIETVSKGRTTIIIAHRFSTIKSADKIFVFEKGKLVGEGTHSELALSCEHYQRLVKNQQIAA